MLQKLINHHLFMRYKSVTQEKFKPAAGELQQIVSGFLASGKVS